MRCLSAILLVAMVPAVALAQGRTVTHTDARRYIGEEVTIEGPVAKVTPSGGGSLWLSLGEAHPRGTIVIVMTEEFARTIQDPSRYEGAVIRAYGRIRSAGTSGGMQARGNETGPRLQGAAPRTPYLVLEDLSRLTVVSRPDTTSARPTRR